MYSLVWSPPDAEMADSVRLMYIHVPAAWLSLDEGDNDPVRFWRYVVGGLDPSTISSGSSSPSRPLPRRTALVPIGPGKSERTQICYGASHRWTLLR